MILSRGSVYNVFSFLNRSLTFCHGMTFYGKQNMTKMLERAKLIRLRKLEEVVESYDPPQPEVIFDKTD